MKKSSDNKPMLKSWLFSQPAKFVLLSFGLMSGIMLAYSLLNIAFGATVSVLMALMALGLAFSICMLVRWLPRENLDRRSFVAVNNGLTFIYFTFILLSAMFAAFSMQHILVDILWLQNYSMILFIAAAIVLSLIYLYSLGLIISNVYATYRRAICMGVPYWKALLSLPFGLMLLFFPGYFLNDEKTKSAIKIKTKWYSAFTDWVVARPFNAISVFLATLAFSAFFMNVYSACLTAVFAVIFAVWVRIANASTLRKSVGGAFASFAAALNIALILAAIIYMVVSPRAPAVSQQPIDETYTELTTES